MLFIGFIVVSNRICVTSRIGRERDTGRIDGEYETYRCVLQCVYDKIGWFVIGQNFLTFVAYVTIFEVKLVMNVPHIEYHR